MWYTAKIGAYDVLDSVQVTWTVSAQDHKGESVVKVVTGSTRFQGEGEPDPGEWLRDVLVATLEGL